MLSIPLITCDPPDFRANLCAHVATMSPLGFNAHALALLAARYPYTVLGSPDALAAHYTMLRNVFHPCGDGIAQDLSKTVISWECLPAVAKDADPPTSTALAAASKRGLCSLVHKAMLAGPIDMLRWTREGLEAHMRTLVPAGLFAAEADALRGCMLRHGFLRSYRLEWYLERRAAVLEAGGTADDVLAACCQNANLRTALPCLLLWQRSKCATCNWSLGLLSCLFGSGPGHNQWRRQRLCGAMVTLHTATTLCSSTIFGCFTVIRPDCL